MAKLGVFTGEKSKWIQFDADTEVRIRLIGKKELREIVNKAEKAARKTGANSQDIVDRKIGRASVLGWRKIKDHDHPGLIVGDQPLQFTPENVDMLMDLSIDFTRFVNQNCSEEKEFIDEDETEIKNA
ncbi:MAG: hypothetical protein HZB62_10795 [Nitrospirae bacterium]|nr:hypothetical protein [Nitrospirota bacterium]